MSKMIRYEDLLYEFELKYGRKPTKEEVNKIKSYIYESLRNQEIDGYIVDNDLEESDICILANDILLSDIQNNSIVVCDDVVIKNKNILFMKKAKAKNIKVFKKEKEITVKNILLFINIYNNNIDNFNVLNIYYVNGNKIKIYFDFKKNSIIYYVNDIRHKKDVFYIRLNDIINKNIFVLFVFNENTININLYKKGLDNNYYNNDYYSNLLSDENKLYSIVIDTKINKLNEKVKSLHFFDNKKYLNIYAIYIRESYKLSFFKLRKYNDKRYMKKNKKIKTNNYIVDRDVIDDVFFYNFFINDEFNFNRENYFIYLENDICDTCNKIENKVVVDENDNICINVSDTLITTEEYVDGVSYTDFKNERKKTDYVKDSIVKNLNNKDSLLFTVTFSIEKNDFIINILKNKKNKRQFISGPSYFIRRHNCDLYEDFYFFFIMVITGDYIFIETCLNTVVHTNSDSNNKDKKIYGIYSCVYNRYSLEEFEDKFLYNNNYVFSASNIVISRKFDFIKLELEEFYNIMAESFSSYASISNFNNERVTHNCYQAYNSQNFLEEETDNGNNYLYDLVKDKVDEDNSVCLPVFNSDIEAEEYAKEIPFFMLNNFITLKEDGCEGERLLFVGNEILNIKISDMKLVSNIKNKININCDNVSESEQKIKEYLTRMQEEPLNKLKKSL